MLLTSSDGRSTSVSGLAGLAVGASESGQVWTLALQQGNRGGLYPYGEIAAALPRHPAFRNLCVNSWEHGFGGNREP
jgi:hypothetical protein